MVLSVVRPYTVDRPANLVNRGLVEKALPLLAGALGMRGQTPGPAHPRWIMRPKGKE